MTELEQVFLMLVRLGIGNKSAGTDTINISPQIDWEALIALANMQGLSAIILDGMEKLHESSRPAKSQLLQWIGSSLQNYESRYELYRRAIAELAGFYNEHSFKMMVLKGYACSLVWPKPEHRPCGDIDIWLFGKQRIADDVLSKEKGIKINNSHHHHSVYYWREFMVENHYDFLDVHHHKSSAEMEKTLKRLGQDDSHFTVLYGEKLYLPSPNLNALFLLRHAIAHFAAIGNSLRQVLDWGFFVQKHGDEVDWEWLLGQLDHYGMRTMFNIYNAICVNDLGFDASIFPEVYFNPVLKEKVLIDIFYPEFSVNSPRGLFKRVLYKWKRWRGNAWKHKLCYKESMWSAFWSGVWGHLLKPKSI